MLKQILEPFDYYTFENKIESERNGYHKLTNLGIKKPMIIDVGIQNERILKEDIHGNTIDVYVKSNRMKNIYYEQIKEMASIVKK